MGGGGMKQTQGQGEQLQKHTASNILKAGLYKNL